MALFTSISATILSRRWKKGKNIKYYHFMRKTGQENEGCPLLLNLPLPYHFPPCLHLPISPEARSYDTHGKWFNSANFTCVGLIILACRHLLPFVNGRTQKLNGGYLFCLEKLSHTVESWGFNYNKMQDWRANQQQWWHISNRNFSDSFVLFLFIFNLEQVHLCTRLNVTFCHTY